MLIQVRKVDDALRAPISDQGIRKLVNLAFFASLMPEEGRYPRYKLTCELGQGSSFLVTQMDPFVLESANPIRRLAPACAHPDCALLVAERDGQLWCDGVMNVGSMGYETTPGYPGLISVGRSPSLKVEVFGPGHLRASEACLETYEIRAGRIRALSAYDAPQPVRILLSSLQDRVTRDVSARMCPSDQNYVTQVKDWRPILQMLSRLLRTAADARHGGAFVFLPGSRPEPCEYGLKILYQTTSLDLGADLVEQWITCLRLLQLYREKGADNNAHRAEIQNTLRQAEVLRTKLLTDTETVSYFSSVDGCVVLDREFKVVGFGAKIDAPVTDAVDSPRRFKHIASGEICDDKTFMAAIGGTRHQSVARLCQIHPGVLAFTLSQDGDLKLFTSDEEFAYAFGPLDLPSERMEILV